ncbi:hypothetical protein [Streptomyces sp. GZWMJZ-114]|uniref:hypothetical protein n=1 Tax=Streptomyces sp. GZWMJZ-114 TaxID=2494734 RepID=UPI0010128F13|nr:hypothetical protein [Streptomyces sp. GZWMJZ-114]
MAPRTPPPPSSASRTPDPLTPARDVPHPHFQTGDQVVVIKGLASGELWGDSLRIVASSWHTPTDEAGWRLRNSTGGEQSYTTAHPRYLAHLSYRCPDCMIYLRAMEGYLLSRLGRRPEVLDCGWYTITPLGQLVHIDDTLPGRRHDTSTRA